MLLGFGIDFDDLGISLAAAPCENFVLKIGKTFEMIFRSGLLIEGGDFGGEADHFDESAEFILGKA